jgi:hypothetical protein
MPNPHALSRIESRLRQHPIHLEVQWNTFPDWTSGFPARRAAEALPPTVCQVELALLPQVLTVGVCALAGVNCYKFDSYFRIFDEGKMPIIFVNFATQIECCLAT